jgi:hypothetical protein
MRKHVEAQERSSGGVSEASSVRVRSSASVDRRSSSANLQHRQSDGFGNVRFDADMQVAMPPGAAPVLPVARRDEKIRSLCVFHGSQIF